MKNKEYSTHPVSVRVRTHRRKASLLADLQTLIKKRGDTSNLDSLEALVQSLQEEEKEAITSRDSQH
jgi:hypothetical protein